MTRKQFKKGDRVVSQMFDGDPRMIYTVTSSQLVRGVEWVKVETPRGERQWMGAQLRPAPADVSYRPRPNSTITGQLTRDETKGGDA